MAHPRLYKMLVVRQYQSTRLGVSVGQTMEASFSDAP
jgi:hypothetical protein